MTEPDFDRLAAEHVMGLLEGEESGIAERLLASDTAFRTMVERWQRRFHELDATTPVAVVNEALWNRIENGLPAAPKKTVIPSPNAALAALWRSLPFWRTAGLAGALASLVLAIGVGVFAARAARQPVMVAVLMTDANRPAAVVNAFANGRAELVPLEGINIPANHSFQVWTFPDPQGAPVSVGVVRDIRTMPLQTEALPHLRPDQLFAISVEPPNGSPTGLPTGPVMMKGTASTAL
jgi:anti-sigma-K factor RskA